MPASPTATPEHIKDVNTRYHDAAADEYDAKWGIDFGATGQRAGAAEAGQGARRARRRALRRRRSRSAPGTGYFSLNLLQLGVDRAADRDRHLAGHAASGSRPPPTALGLERRDRRDRGRGAALRGRELRPRLRPRRPPPHPRPRAGLRRVPAGAAPGRRDRLRRRALPLRRPARGAAEAGRDARRARLAARGRRPRRARRPRPSSPTATRSRARSTSTPSPPPTCAACCATPASSSAASAARSCSPTPGAGACARSSRAPSPNRSPGAGATSPSAATSPCRRSTPRLLEPRLPAELFYNLLVSGRKPA